MMNFFCLLVLLIFLSTIARGNPDNNQDYTHYHQQVVEAEKLLAGEKYSEALKVYEGLFSTYDFVFLREYQIATQLALYLHANQKAILYAKEGIRAGWTWKSIKKNSCLSTLRKNPEWKSLKKDYSSLRSEYQARLDPSVRKQVKKMFRKDQWKALGALFTFSSQKQDRYVEKRFAPHSEKQIRQLIMLLESKGYPGERLIGNNYWVATILSHHNSISQTYAQQDTLFAFLKPELLKAISKAQMSPEEFALIDDWYRVVRFNGQKPGYGYLNPPSLGELVHVNEVRRSIGLGNLEVRNQLIEVENKTGMNFYLPGSPWVQGKIIFKEI